MKKVEKYIKNFTRNCSNEILTYNTDKFTNIPRKGEYEPWLTPDHARAIAEIAREEVIEKALSWLWERYCSEKVIENFKKTMMED